MNFYCITGIIQFLLNILENEFEFQRAVDLEESLPLTKDLAEDLLPKVHLGTVEDSFNEL